jgi:DNA segregation ATPase FtsK/SpoIIIE, S-DNA-T family
MSAIEITQPVPMIRAEGQHARWTPIADAWSQARTSHSFAAIASTVAQVPRSYGRVARHTPRGAWVITRGTWRWFSDADGRKALRRTFETEESFIRARAQHREEIKARAFILLIGSGVAVAGGALGWMHLPNAFEPAVLGTLASSAPLGLGLLGRPEGERERHHGNAAPKERLHVDDIVRALVALDIPKITRAVKDDDRAIRAMIGFDARSGNHQATVDLPGGATADEVMRRHGALCSALRRHQSQVLISQGRTADQVIIKISKERADERKAAIAPTLKAKELDVSEPDGPRHRCHGRRGWVQPRSRAVHRRQERLRKTVAVHNILSSALLDPAAEVWLWDGKGGGDHSAFAPALSVAIIGDGAEDDDMRSQAVAMVKALSAECSRRSALLHEIGAAKGDTRTGARRARSASAGMRGR